MVAGPIVHRDSASAVLNVDAPLSISDQPQPTLACAGAYATFSVTALFASEYTWQVSSDGNEPWEDVELANSAEYRFLAATDDNGKHYRCRVGNACGRLESQSAMLTITGSIPSISEQPISADVCAGQLVEFVVMAGGAPEPTYAWEVSTDDGTSWLPVDGAVDAIYRLTATIEDDGNQYRCSVTNNLCGSVISNSASLIVHDMPSIVVQPADTSVCLLQKLLQVDVSFTVEASNTTHYQWQVSADGGAHWDSIEGADEATYTFPAVHVDHGKQYRCTLSNDYGCGDAVSRAATLFVGYPPIIQEPEAPVQATHCPGHERNLAVQADARPAPTYQWQVRANGQTLWENVPNARTATYPLSIAKADDGKAYRCMVSSGSDATACGMAPSPEVALTVPPVPIISLEPTSVTTCMGSSAEFAVEVAPVDGVPPSVSYQWQESRDGGNTWSGINGEIGPRCVVRAATGFNGRKYRCLIQGVGYCPTYTASVVLSVTDATQEFSRRTDRMSVNSSETQQSSSWYCIPSISGNGQYVAFSSRASNLVSGDTNASYDIFVRDRVKGTTQCVSLAAGDSGVQGNDDSDRPSISTDGRYVAFASRASNLVSDDTNESYDVFVRDRVSGATKRVSLASGTPGEQSNDDSDWPSISADGRYVAFFSYATNLIPGGSGAGHVFVHDLQAHTTEQVSISSSGVEGNSASAFPSISADGLLVAFSSGATNLVNGDTNASWDVFVHDRLSGMTVRVNLSSDGAQSGRDDDAPVPSSSADGSCVVFGSGADNLVPGDTTGWDVFVRDFSASRTERVSVNDAGVPQNISWPCVPSISGNGRFVAFRSPATNLIPADTNGKYDIFVNDRQEHATQRVSISTARIQGNGDAGDAPSISVDGRFVAFASEAPNMVPGDTNASVDVFIRDWGYVCGGSSVVYVNANAAADPLPGTEGCSWETAYRDLQQPLAIATTDAGSKISEIWVAATAPGMPLVPVSPGTPPTGQPRCATFRLVSGVAVYGGFPAGGGTWDQRNAALNQTVLSNTIDNCQSIITTSPNAGRSGTPILDGFFIQAPANASIDSVNEFQIDGAVVISNCTIMTEGNRYLDLDPRPGNPTPPALSNNRINVNIKRSDADGVAGALLELRSQDHDCLGASCDSGIIEATDSSVFAGDPSSNWVLESLEIQAGAQVNLVNRQGFDYHGQSGMEVGYVRNVILRQNATLNLGLQRLYYAHLIQEPGSKISNVPLLGFSLFNIAFDNTTDFKTRVQTRLRDEVHDVQPSYPGVPLEGDIARIENGRGPENGIMMMTTQAHLKGAASSVAAKGLFRPAGEEVIIVTFEYLFADTGALDPAELLVYLCDRPEMLQPGDPQRQDHYYEIGRVRPPARDEVGTDPPGIGTGDYARFYLEVPYEQWFAHLSGFPHGTYIELELRGDGAEVYVDSFDPQITCRYECASLDGVQGVTEADFLILLAEYGRSTLQTEHWCLDMKFTRDQHVDLSDLLSWDTYIAGGFNSCGAGGATTNHGNSGKPALITAATFSPNSLVVAGKPNGGGNQQDRIYTLNTSGGQTGVQNPWSKSPPPSPAGYRSHGRLIRDKYNNVHQLHGTQGLIRNDDMVVIPPKSRDTGGLSWNGKPVSVGITPTGGTTFSGIPFTDVVLDPNDPNVAYVTPVLVWAADHSFRATARLKLLPRTPGPFDYTLEAVFGADPWEDPCAKATTPPEASYSATRLREVELDRTGSRLFATSSRADNSNEWLLIYNTQSLAETRHRLTSLSAALTSPTAMLVSSKFDKLYLASADASHVGSLHRLDIAGGAPTHDGELALPAAPAGHIRQITALSEDPDTGTLYVLGFQMPLFSEQQVFSNTDSIFAAPILLAVTPAESWPTSQVSLIPISGSDLALPVSLAYLPVNPADFNADGHVNLVDLEIFIACASGPAVPYNASALTTGCDPMPVTESIIAADLDGDHDVDVADFAVLQRAFNP